MALTSLCHTHEWRVDESLCSRYILQSSNHAHWQYNGLIPWAAIQVCKVAFTNYVDKILAFFDHLPTLVDIGEEIPSLLKGKICTSLTFPLPPTYLPRLVNVVCECPLTQGSNRYNIVLCWLNSGEKTAKPRWDTWCVAVYLLLYRVFTAGKYF